MFRYFPVFQRKRVTFFLRDQRPWRLVHPRATAHQCPVIVERCVPTFRFSPRFWGMRSGKVFSTLINTRLCVSWNPQGRCLTFQSSRLVCIWTERSRKCQGLCHGKWLRGLEFNRSRHSLAILLRTSCSFFSFRPPGTGIGLGTWRDLHLAVISSPQLKHEAGGWFCCLFMPLGAARLWGSLLSRREQKILNSAPETLHWDPSL